MDDSYHQWRLPSRLEVNMISVAEAKAIILMTAKTKNVSIEEACKVAWEGMEAATRDTMRLIMAVNGQSQEEAEKMVEQLPSRKNVREAIHQLRVEAN